MNRKTKIIVSVVGITIVLLALLGITYAYYLTRIEGNTNTNSISVTTADLKLTYGDGNGLITKSDIMPGTTITKTFTVTNDGESRVDNYVVVLEKIVNTLSRTQDLTYTLECKLANENSCGSTELVNNKGPVFPSGVTEKAIFLNSIDKDVTHYYTLVVTYENLTDIDQSIDMGSSISALVNIKDSKGMDTTGLKNPSNTIANTIIAQYGGENTITEVTDFSTVTTGLYKAEDDYGENSYYFRGNVTNNYVKFGTYKEPTDYCYLNSDLSETCFVTEAACNLEAQSVCNDDQYSEACSGCYLESDKGSDLRGNIGASIYWRIVRINGDNSIRMIYSGPEPNSNSLIITNVGSMTENYVSSAAYSFSWYRYHLRDLSEYISDSIFCNDRQMANSEQTAWDVRYSNRAPSLICTDSDELTVANSSLEYPIGGLTADEAFMSGANYLSASSKFNTMTAGYNNALQEIGLISFPGLSQMDDPTGLRPVINLKADVPFTIDEDGIYVITTS